MKICQVTDAERADFLALVNAEIRPDRAKTHAWDDFPLILGPENQENQLVCLDPQGLVIGGIASLIREFKTSCGKIKVGGVGSVVTHPDHRGKGLSAALQNEMVALLKRKNVPLAVLWTDQPEIYAGRGFLPAGWELHGQLKGLNDQGKLLAGLTVRDFQAADTAAVEALYRQHQLGTCRLPGDSASLYGMPGTQGLVAEDSSGRLTAAVFCGKGADFPGYVTEWSGAFAPALGLMLNAQQRGWANQVLVPAGSEAMVNHLVDRGGSWFALASGYWKIIDVPSLKDLVPPEDWPEADQAEDPVAWLGTVDDHGQPLVGPLTVAVWGFDSV